MHGYICMTGLHYIQAQECQHNANMSIYNLFYISHCLYHVFSLLLACSGFMPCSSCTWQDFQTHTPYSVEIVCNIPTYYVRQASLALVREANHVWFQDWKTPFQVFKCWPVCAAKTKHPCHTELFTAQAANIVPILSFWLAYPVVGVRWLKNLVAHHVWCNVYAREFHWWTFFPVAAEMASSSIMHPATSADFMDLPKHSTWFDLCTQSCWMNVV